MVSTVASLLTEIDAECAALGPQIDEDQRLGAEIEQFAGELIKLELPRRDIETLSAITNELSVMTQIYSDGKDIVEEITAKLIEATSANPSDYHAALCDILEMAKRARSHRAASIQELKRIRSRVMELLDSAKPKD